MNSLPPKNSPDPVGGGGGGGGSASASEKHATSTAARPAPNPKLRSCAVCRRRKVRCDKASPCANCRRANIACVFPSDDRPPRWARRLERLATETASASATPSTEPDPQAVQVMERLRSLEALVKELSSQLEQTNIATGFEAAGSVSSVTSHHSPPAGGSLHRGAADQDMDTSSIASTANVQNQFGRLVLKDATRSRYVSSGFWSRVDVSQLWPLCTAVRGLSRMLPREFFIFYFFYLFLIRQDCPISSCLASILSANNCLPPRNRMK